MKITYLKLTNFVNIVTAFKTNTVEIDFSESKNNVILLTGPNGSGKTSILSCLHPFATNGTLDVRDSNSLIVTGEDGYKEIHIESGNDFYIIKHFYTHSKDTHTVKSYIEKNGSELNENGNVTSFKEVIEKEFGLEMDYMKLTRLGSNVTNFIDMKRMDRKNFTGKIINEADIYLAYFKKISNDRRKVSTTIKHITDMITRLHIDSIDDLKDAQKSIEKQIADYKKKIEKAHEELSVYQYQLNDCGDLDILQSTLKDREKELKHIQKALDKIHSEKLDVDTLKKKLEEDKISLIKTKSDLEGAKLSRTNLINQLDSIISEIDDVRREIDRIENDQNIKDMTAIIQKLRDKISQRAKETKIASYIAPCTKAQMEEFIKTLDGCMDILMSTYELGKEPIKKAISFIHSGTNADDYAKKNQEKIKRNRLQSLCEQVYAELSKDMGIIAPDCKDPAGCRVCDFYRKVYDYATQNPDKLVEDETFVAYTKIASTNIRKVLSIIRNYKELVMDNELMPDKIRKHFSLDAVFTRIENMQWIYDKDLLYSELSMITEYELNEADLDELRRQKDMLSKYKESNSNGAYFHDKLESLCDERITVTENLAKTKEKIRAMEELIDALSQSIDDYEDLITSMERKDTIQSEYETLTITIAKAKELIQQVIQAKQYIATLEYTKSKLEKDYQNNDYRIKSYKDLTKDLKEQNQKFSDLDYLSRALSSKEGIPLIFIQAYLKDIKDITNDLLDVAYNGDLRLNNFEITADEFGIPYTTKGHKVKDVIYASQGERSFISLALSFALTCRSLTRYNIMLLDEIDATLDTENREKFLRILEMQIEMIHAEQVFVISHNDMFNAYPVDIIDTKGRKNKNAELASYIPILKS